MDKSTAPHRFSERRSERHCDHIKTIEVREREFEVVKNEMAEVVAPPQRVVEGAKARKVDDDQGSWPLPPYMAVPYPEQRGHTAYLTFCTLLPWGYDERAPYLDGRPLPTFPSTPEACTRTRRARTRRWRRPGRRSRRRRNRPPASPGGWSHDGQTRRAARGARPDPAVAHLRVPFSASHPSLVVMPPSQDTTRRPSGNMATHLTYDEARSSQKYSGRRNAHRPSALPASPRMSPVATPQTLSVLSATQTRRAARPETRQRRGPTTKAHHHKSTVDAAQRT